MNRKHEIRRQAQLARQRLPVAAKDDLSRRIMGRLLALPEYAAASTVLWYVGVRNEVRTQEVVADEMSATARRIAIPWCEGESLLLFHLQDLEDLSTGAYGILEPRADLRGQRLRLVRPDDIDLAIIPGVAFDPAGNRLGHGMGYYDRLLAGVRPDALLIGLAFECQMVEAIPAEPHDRPMDLVITEEAIYAGRARKRSDRFQNVPLS